MEAVVASVVIVLLLLTLRDEFRCRGSLDWRGHGLDAGELAELLEFELPDSWAADDVVRTYAEIQSL